MQVDLVVPVEVIRIVVSGSTWRRSVARADALRRFATTSIRVERKVEDDESWEALFLGVGITVAGPDGDTDVIAPERASMWPVAVSRWRLSELCWQHLLEPRPRVHAGPSNQAFGGPLTWNDNVPKSVCWATNLFDANENEEVLRPPPNRL